ncbi:MAG: hypothetical protein K2X90_02335 [Candidatus Babeliaceae bacterium]|nr:hypothetical protein [Candidatus Babeliaceae bacterium]
MRYSLRLLPLFMYYSSAFVSGYLLHSDQEAFAHCVNNQNTFIAIIWPIAQGKETVIQNIMNRYGKILYKKEMYFTPKKALYVLKKAHANANISNMKEHLNWYFPKGTYAQPARIFVLEFKDMAHNLACKYAIRKLYPYLQYRSIHINDYHYEAIELAKLFF